MKTTNTDRGILHIKDLDAITTKAETEAALIDIVGSSDIVVRSLRPAFGKTQIATVETTDKVAEILVKRGRVRIGMSQCRVRERIQLTRCYRCWQFGHLAV